MRAAGILSRLAAEGRPVDRAGNGIVVEVYPAASLRCWGLPFRAYKGGKRRGAREALIGALLERTPWLDLGAYVDLCADSDDALDAVIAALTSRAAALSKTSTPDEAHLLQQARREGWIVLPEAPLESLVAPFHVEADAS
jgi:predicted nuclease with RNAse H fold